MSSAMRVAHQNTAGSFFIVTISGVLVTDAGANTTTVVNAGEVLIDLGHVVSAPTGATGVLKKVAKISNPLTSGYVHLPVAVDVQTPGARDVGPAVAKFQL